LAQLHFPYYLVFLRDITHGADWLEGQAGFFI